MSLWMSRSPVTVVVLAWNSWETTRACLDSLRPTLGVRDQVVVVDNGSRDATPVGLAGYPWVDVVTNEVNRGFAGGCNDGAAAARHDLIIFLNNDTLLAPRWIEPLVAAFEDPSVAAAGPRSNFVSGPQVVPEAVYSSPAEMRRFTRSWAESHRAMITPADVLIGFALAVRTDIFDKVGRFDEGYGIGGFEDNDLCRRITAAGYKLVICHESFVHHEGHKTFQANGLDWYAEQESNRSRFVGTHGKGSDADRPIMISACLITKDEEDRIEECLSSLKVIADEIVVYDTGSKDATIDKVREAGATVIAGFWDDDFSRARNDALAHCRGDWVVWLDADETLQVDDASQLRTLLASTRADIDAWSVRIDNLTGVGAGSSFSHHAARMFRRARCEWTGRLHEQIALRLNHGPIVQAELSKGAWIRHTGYLDEALLAKNKAERNIRLAQAEVDDAVSWDRGYSLTSLGRSLILAGRIDDGLERLKEAVDLTDSAITRRLALQSGINAMSLVGRQSDALEWCQRLRAEGGDTNTVSSLEAPLYLAIGGYEKALQLLEGVACGKSDADGFAPSPGTVAAHKAQALSALGRFAEAADVLMATLGEDGVLDTHLGSLVDFMAKADRPFSLLAGLIPADRTKLFMAQVLQLKPDVADRVLDAWIPSGVATQALLATAAALAPRLPIERAMIWSARLREAGQTMSCPLICQALSDSPPVLRARAAAIALAAFKDDRALDAFSTAWHDSHDVERHRIEIEASSLAPDLISAASGIGQLTVGSYPDEPLPASSHRHSKQGAPPRATIVISCFNRADLTAGCLKSVAEATNMDGVELVIVDNGSTDETRLIESSNSARLTVVRNNVNLGFAKACNQGAAAASSDVFVFLNNDITALPGWLDAMLDLLDLERNVGIVGARLLYPDGTIQHGGVDVTVGNDGHLRGQHRFVGEQAAYPPANVLSEVEAVTGAALCIRRACFEEVGGFSEEYWNGNEDIDLCLSARACGWSVVYEPDSTLVYLESKSGPERFSRYQHNVDAFTKRWQSRRSAPRSLTTERQTV